MINKQQQLKLSGERVRNFQLNSSTSKMQYSFPRSQRFRTETAECSKHSYALPDIRLQRAPSFGLGTKITLENNSQLNTPGPAMYSPEQESRKGRGYTFGVSRDVTTASEHRKPKCYSFLKHDQTIPGPAAYPEHRQSSLTRSYSMPKSMLKHQRQNREDSPGPGNYNQQDVNRNHKFILAKFKNLPSTLIPQFKARCKTEHCPGPSDYDVENVDRRANRLLSNKNSHKGYSFGTAKRELPSFLVLSKQKPGPGEYFRFSEFLS